MATYWYGDHRFVDQLGNPGRLILDGATLEGTANFSLAPSDNRYIQLLPVDDHTSAGSPNTLDVWRNLGGGDNASGNNLWTFRSRFNPGATSPGTGIRYNGFFSSTCTAGVNPGELWNLMARVYTEAPDTSENHVAFYAQAERGADPAAGVGVPLLGAVIETRDKSSTGAPLARTIELDMFANGADTAASGIGREVITVVLGKANDALTAPEINSIMGVYPSAGVTGDYGIHFEGNLLRSHSFFATIGAADHQSGAHEIWLKTGHHVALDTAGNCYLSSDGSTITSTVGWAWGSTTGSAIQVDVKAAAGVERQLRFFSGSNVAFQVGVNSSNNLVFGRYSAGVFSENPIRIDGSTGTVNVTTALTVATQTPASAAASGTTGTIAWDASYIYVCTATNTWKRAAIATW